MSDTLTVAMTPKNIDNAYFVAARKGAEQAAAEIGVDLVWKGPRYDDPQRQLALIREWTAARVNVIAASVADSGVVSPALCAARASGIKVVTWDADGTRPSRDLMVVPADAEGIGQTLAAEASRVMLGRGGFAVITASLHSPNQNAWIAALRARLPEHPDVQLLAVEPCNESASEARSVADRLLASHPTLGAILALCTPALRPAVEAVQASGRKDVRVVGTGAPNGLRPAIESGEIASIVGWNPTDLGYLTVHAAAGLVRGTLDRELATFAAGRLGRVFLREDELRLGRLYVYSQANLDRIPA